MESMRVLFHLSPCFCEMAASLPTKLSLCGHDVMNIQQWQLKKTIFVYEGENMKYTLRIESWPRTFQRFNSQCFFSTQSKVISLLDGTLDKWEVKLRCPILTEPESSKFCHWWLRLIELLRHSLIPRGSEWRCANWKRERVFDEVKRTRSLDAFLLVISCGPL